MPDYSHSITYSIPNTYTNYDYEIPDDGWIAASFIGDSGYIKVNGEIINVAGPHGAYCIGNITTFFPVNKGDIISLYANSTDTFCSASTLLKFFPYKK